MAASFVQKAQASVAGTVAAPVFGSSTPVGNIILAFLDYDNVGGTFTSITDDLGQTYTQISVELSGVSLGTRVYWTKNGTAGIRTVTVTCGAGTTFVECDIAEYTGQQPTTPIDSNNSVVPANGTDPTLSDTTVGDNTLLVAWAVSSMGGGTTSVTTAGFSANRLSGKRCLADKVITPAGAQTVTYHDTVSSPWHLWLVGLRSATFTGSLALPATGAFADTSTEQLPASLAVPVTSAFADSTTATLVGSLAASVVGGFDTTVTGPQTGAVTLPVAGAIAMSATGGSGGGGGAGGDTGGGGGGFIIGSPGGYTIRRPYPGPPRSPFARTRTGRYR